jgi:hypothetical protein
VHAIEMVRLNARALQLLFGTFRVPGAVHHLAMSNYSGVASYRSAQAVGLEHYELNRDVDKFRSERVACATLDAFASEQLAGGRAVGARATTAAAGGGSPRIDLLSVDVEGQDALVLEGASSLLESRAIGVLEFEFIGRGFWRADHADQRKLKPTLDALSRRGYHCYWQGESGQLAPASGAFWCDSFQFRLRSNLVCSHRGDVLSAFEKLSITQRGRTSEQG